MVLENDVGNKILSPEEIHALSREEQDKLYEKKYSQARQIYDIWRESKIREVSEKPYPK